jgi:hypothetical protein
MNGAAGVVERNTNRENRQHPVFFMVRHEQPKFARQKRTHDQLLYADPLILKHMVAGDYRSSINRACFNHA